MLASPPFASDELFRIVNVQRYPIQSAPLVDDADVSTTYGTRPGIHLSEYDRLLFFGRTE